MAQTPVTVQAILGTTASAVYTCPTGATAYVAKLLVCNYTTSSRTWSLWLVPSGQSATDGRRLVRERTLLPYTDPAGGTEDVREAAGLVLKAGDALHMSASATSSVAVTLQAIEVTQ